MPAIDLTLPSATDPSDHKVLGDIATVGWHVVGITEEGELPPYAFSVGMFYSLGSPELVVVGLPHRLGAELLNLLGSYVKGGNPLVCHVPLHGHLTGTDIILKPVARSRYAAELGYAVWLYRGRPEGFPCWQVFWPDKQGLFPWQDGCSDWLKKRQTDLSQDVSQSH